MHCSRYDRLWWSTQSEQACMQGDVNTENMKVRNRPASLSRTTDVCLKAATDYATVRGSRFDGDFPCERHVAKCVFAYSGEQASTVRR